MQGELHDDEIVLRDDPLNDGGWLIQIVTKRLESLSEPLATLWPGSVLNEVLGDEIERRFLASACSLVEREDNLTRSHEAIPSLGDREL